MMTSYFKNFTHNSANLKIDFSDAKVKDNCCLSHAHNYCSETHKKKFKKSSRFLV